ncbi:hypothetical protein CSOJ01_09117 [Colletotrichum sojae]|uniref:Uncharacterized protein n=1 Tax=Colletotrichum sojae TaxID=2175907 RepID=A0A8H6J3N9_9PEZI|nr:hypothetical protein CSOJ01_09117 [Colletotrichum sojae]
MPVVIKLTTLSFNLAFDNLDTPPDPSPPRGLPPGIVHAQTRVAIDADGFSVPSSKTPHDPWQYAVFRSGCFPITAMASDKSQAHIRSAR